MKKVLFILLSLIAWEVKADTGSGHYENNDRGREERQQDNDDDAKGK